MSISLESVLAKTPKGVDEIATRAHRLPARLRSALVMVDGNRTVAEMLENAGPLAEQLEQQLADLVKSGFLADRNPAPAPIETPVAPATQAVPQSAPIFASSVDLPQVKSVEQVKIAEPVKATAVPAPPPMPIPAPVAAPAMDDAKSGDLRDMLFGKR